MDGILTEAQVRSLFDGIFAGELEVTSGGGFDKFWGTVMDAEVKLSEPSNEEGKTGFGPQLTLIIQPDEANFPVYERFRLPTDRKTGEAKRLANTNSKLGKFLQQVREVAGVDTSAGVNSIIGAHGLFDTKGVKLSREDVTEGKRIPFGELPHGRYLVEVDYFDQQVRAAKGLPPKGIEATPATAVATAPAATQALNPEEEAMGILHGKTFLDYVAEMGKHPHLAAFKKRTQVEAWLADGLVTAEGTGVKTIFHVVE
jgi:hypothetical protein